MWQGKEPHLEKTQQYVEEQKELPERGGEGTGLRVVLKKLLNCCYKYLNIPVIALSLCSIIVL